MDFASLQHSVFLQSLGSAILNSLWQGFILWFLYEIITVYYKAASAKFKNNVSTLLLFLSFIWFTITLASNLINQQAIAATTITPGLHTAQITVQATSAFEQFLTYISTSISYLSIAYIFLLFFLIAKLFAAYRHVYIISNKGLIAPPVAVSSFTVKAAMQMNITRKLTIWISNHLDVPATIGFIKPVILIPFASLNNLSESQLEAIILHELSHIKRNDYIINIIISVIETILFFNPFVALLSTVIKRERENCCDDFVLQYQYDPHSYALALLRLEQSRVSNLKLAIGAVSGKKQLLSRIKRITNGQVRTTQFNYGQKLLALLVVTIVISSVAWLSPVEKKHANAKVIVKPATQVKIQKVLPYTNPSKQPIVPKENLHPKILKDILIKKGEISFKETDVPSPLVQDDDLNVRSVAPLNAEKLPAPQPFNLKNAHFFFDSVKMKLPTLINIQDLPLPFQNMAFNIDLSKIDLGKLNENLKQAYAEINALDWVKINNEIQESLSKIKMDNFPSNQQIQQYLEKAESFSKKRVQAKKYNSEIFRERMQQQIKQYAINKARLAKIERESPRDVNEYAENINTNTYTVANSDWKESDNIPGNNDVQVFRYKSIPTKDKNLVISINQTSNSALKNGKRILRLSFKNDSENPESSKVISFEVNDTP